MTRNNLSLSQWQTYPMGPNLANWLGFDDYSISDNIQKDRDAREQINQSNENLDCFDKDQGFSDFLLDRLNQPLEDIPPLSSEGLALILEELIQMALPIPVMKFAEKYPFDDQDIDSITRFRFELAKGAAAMQLEELDIAEHSFKVAQKMVPEEVAPYINLLQIFLYEQRAEEAGIWLKAALKASSNNMQLWDLAASLAQNIYSSNSEDENSKVYSFIAALAKEHDSWAGHALLSELEQRADKKAKVLSSYYAQGERSIEFLIEYTGALGADSQYEKIPPIVWQFENSLLTNTTNNRGKHNIAWQLQMHCCQAFLALNQYEQFLQYCEKITQNDSLPDMAKKHLEQLRVEVNQELGKNLH
ncbi:MAG: hypothetical protein R3B45_01965 [Bdellovibrionota bacterium]